MFEWNQQQVAKLKCLWDEGLSSAEIGKKMGGLSRNAILGKAHRLGLAGRKNPDASRKPRKSRMKTGIERKVIAPKIVPDRPPPPPEGGVSFHDLAGKHCREIVGWDAGAAGLARYCGGTKTDDSSYCAEHYKKNYVPARIR